LVVVELATLEIREILVMMELAEAEAVPEELVSLIGALLVCTMFSPIVFLNLVETEGMVVAATPQEDLAVPSRVPTESWGPTAMLALAETRERFKIRLLLIIHLVEAMLETPELVEVEAVVEVRD